MRRAEAVTGRACPSPIPHPVNFGAASDGSFYEAAGIPAVVYGPGDLKIAHCRDEYVVLDEVGSPRRHWPRFWNGVAMSEALERIRSAIDARRGRAIELLHELVRT